MTFMLERNCCFLLTFLRCSLKAVVNVPINFFFFFFFCRKRPLLNTFDNPTCKNLGVALQRTRHWKNLRYRFPSSFAFLVTMKIVQLHSDQGRSYESFFICFARAMIHSTVTPSQTPHQSLCDFGHAVQMAGVPEVSLLYLFCPYQVPTTSNCLFGSYSHFVLLNWSIFVFIFEFTFPDSERSRSDSPETCFLWI